MSEDTIRKAIKQGNYIKNECWINSLTDFYSDTIMNERTRNRLTRDKIIEIIGRNDFKEVGATIQEMEAVFRQFNIQVRIFNFVNELIYKYNPKIRNRHIKTFYAMVKNNHIYTLNHDLSKIQQKQVISKLPTIKAHTDYYINEREEPPQYKMIKCIDDILKIKTDDKTREVYLVPEDNNLAEIFFQLINIGYEPRIKYTGIIDEIRVKFNKITYIIKTQNLIKSSSDGWIAANNETMYNNMNKAMFNFNKSLFILSHKSFYNDIDIKILHETRTVAPSGLLWDKFNLMRKTEIDENKAFTKGFIDITEIPVFNQFDNWKEYTDAINIDELHDLTLYYIEVNYPNIPNEYSMERIKRNHLLEESLKFKSKEEVEFIMTKTVLGNKEGLMFNKKYNLVYGKFLKKFINQYNIKVLYYKQPSFIHKTNYKDMVNELWKTTIDEDDDDDDILSKKLIANVNFGLLEKGEATAHQSILFKSIDEAIHYQTEYGGKIHKLSQIEGKIHRLSRIGTEDEEREDEYEEYTRELDERNIKASYYILKLRDKAVLRNGYRYIKELLMQHHNFKMNQDIHKLIINDINVYSVKTDAFVIDSYNVEKAKQLLEFHNDIGGWKVSGRDNEINLPTVKYEVVKNDLIKIPVHESKTIDIKDEYDTDNIIEIVKQNNPIMIRGELPGTGKSYICQKMVDKRYKVIFICPTNKLLQAFEGEAMTINKFFGINYGDAKLEPFDFTEFDVIVFDEIYFSNLNIYWRIKQFVEQNKHNKIIIATGDTKQLKPVQEITNTRDYELYTDNIIDNIFEYNILLKECKRLNTQEDKDKLRNIKFDIFENKLPIMKVIEKYFEYTTDISNSNNNIAFLNTTCKNVSNEIRKLENREDEYEVGEFLTCREYTKTKTSVFNVNFKYKIVHIGSDGIFTLKNVKTEILQSVEVAKIRSNFIFAYCSTCHSAQGSSIDDTITIFDYNHFLVKNYPEWIWTAITRCRDLNKVKFYKYTKDIDDVFNQKCIMSYFERKILNYKEQDRKAKRTIPKEGYVNAQWFLDNINNQCNYCGCGFSMDMKNGNIMTNLTAQRKDNELTHTIGNIIPYCCRCNCSCK